VNAFLPGFFFVIARLDRAIQYSMTALWVAGLPAFAGNDGVCG
jgi:hypothetical protein